MLVTKCAGVTKRAATASLSADSTLSYTISKIVFESERHLRSFTESLITDLYKNHSWGLDITTTTKTTTTKKKSNTTTNDFVNGEDDDEDEKCKIKI